ncbi:phage tail assembly chaperone [Parasphingopyxis sp. GrpM-11]|uniref:Phage tail assembly chaperone n=2 Tax=Parasphingopyxis marina TaxID=2761622 RepID=A0A842I234_9SPHN|nr:phage tail assembly chaperone [Parasphingopyxis marina]
MLFCWRPADFWAATPAELAAIFAAMRGEEPEGDPLAPGDFARLMEQYPDG